MKKILHIILIFLFNLTIISCAKKSSSSSSDTTTTTDTTAPTVCSTSPSDNQSGVSFSDNISVTFSESMDNTSVTTNTDNTTCYGSFALSSDNFSNCLQMSSSPTRSHSYKTFVVDPSDNISISTTYKIRMTTGVKDSAGNAMSSQYERSNVFTTTGNFSKKKNALNINIEGEGTVTGEVISTYKNYDSGTIVRLVAIPDTDNNWEFEGWTGAIESTELIIEFTVLEVKQVNAKFMRYFDYKVPSHDWDNYYQDWFDLAGIIDSLGFSKNDSYNTNAAYADFNFDGYLDIMIQPNVNDGVPVESFFLINTGLNKFYIDNDFPFSAETSAISSRKTIVGDFNGDGKPDVVRPQGGHDRLGKPTITLSNEDNSYTLKLIGNGPEIQPHTISSGDLDNDGDLDIFLAQAGEQDGFLINDGRANFEWKWISEVIEDFESGFLYPNGKYGAYGFWSSEITDVDNDGNVDLILGGSYKDMDYDSGFYGPTILWGNGSGKFYSKNSTTIFNDRDDLNYLNGDRISLSHDYSVADINKDGFKDVVIFSNLRNDQNGVFYQFVMDTGNRNYIDKTFDLLPNFYRTGTGGNHVWLLLRDIDKDGNINIIEGEPVLAIPAGYRNSVNWNWNGCKFEKIN